MLRMSQLAGGAFSSRPYVYINSGFGRPLVETEVKVRSEIGRVKK